MRGLTEEGIIIFPKVETYDARNHLYHDSLKASLNNIVKYCSKQGVTLRAFTTDGLAVMLRIPGIEFVSPVTEADEYFIRNNCEGYEDMPKGIMNDKLLSPILTKYPNQRGLSVEDRFNLVLKREKKGVQAILEQANLIVNFSHPKNPAFKVPESKENDGKLIIKVSHVNNQVDTYMGGINISPIDILNFPGATRPLHLWEDSDYER